VRAADEAAIKLMFEEVKSWVAETHRGYPIDIESLYASITLKVTTDNNAIRSSLERSAWVSAQLAVSMSTTALCCMNFAMP